MKIHQLQRLFRYIPDNIIQELKGIDFKTCWYGSAALDKRPLELLDPSHPDALISEKVQVFFYTDIEYAYLDGSFHSTYSPVDFEKGQHAPYDFQGIKPGIMHPYPLEFQKRHHDFINQNALTVNHQEKFNRKYFNFKMIERKQSQNWKNADEILSNIDKQTKDKLMLDLSEQTQYIINHGEVSFDDFCQYYEYNITLVNHKAVDGSNIYCFYIDCDDWTFERLLLKEKVKINYLAHWGGWAGPGPRCLANLNADYFLGNFQQGNMEPDFEIKPFTTEIIKEFTWKINDLNPHLFSKVVY